MGFKWKYWNLKMDYESLICCSLAFLLYYNTLDSEFVYDDRRAILTNPDLLPRTPLHRLLENDFWGTPITDSSSHGSYRPLSVLSFRLNYLIGEYDPWGYHFVNVFLHCLATYLLIKIARNVLPKGEGSIGPFVTGILFASHPIHTEAVASVVGRADLLACNFFFLSLLAYTAHVSNRNSTCCSKTCDHLSTASKSNHKRYERIATTLQKSVTSCNWPKNKGTVQNHRDDRASSRHRVNDSKNDDLPSKFCCWVTFIKIWWYILLCIVLAVCAMLSKETGITVLGVSFVYDFVYAKVQKKEGGSLAQRKRSRFTFTPPSVFAATCLSSAVRGLKLRRPYDAIGQICRMLNVITKTFHLFISVVDKVVEKVANPCRLQKQTKSFFILAAALLLILAARLQTKSPQFSTADNPTARESGSSTRLMTFSYLPVLNFWMLLYPSSLSFDWGMDAIPRVNSIRDPRVFFTLCFYGILTIVLGCCICGILEKRYRWFEEHKPYSKVECDVCHRRNSDSHSHNCKITNNNNTTHNHPFLCVCPAGVKKTSTNRSSQEAIIFSLSFIVLPFLPASNLFFHVGFVVAERVLYIPSAGFCLLMGIASINLWKRYYIQKYFCAGLVVVLLGFSAKTVLRNRDWFDEEALYRSAIPYNPPKAYGNLGSILNTKGRVEEAETLFRMALEHRPNMADVHYNLAILLQGKQKLDEAIQSYQRAIHFRPSLALAYVNLGTALIAVGRCEEAITILRQASKLDGTGLKDRREHENAKISALLQLGALYSDQGRLQSALSVYREAAENLPEHYPPQKVYNVLGETLAKMQQDEEAEKWYRAALKAEPDHVPAHITYGKLLAKNVSRSAEAEQWFRKAQRLAPNDASVYHHYGAFLVINRRYSEAAYMYERAAELSPDDFELAVAAATAMRKAGRQEDAEKWYRQSVKMKPTDPRGHTNLGAMLHLNGKYKEAEHSYKKALRLQPDDETTLTNLQRLYGIMT